MTVPIGASRSSERWRPSDVSTSYARPGRAHRRRRPGSAKIDAERIRDGGASGIHVDERDLHRREPAQQARDAASSHHPGPATTVTRSPSSGAASQRALTAVSTVPASTARAGWHLLGHQGTPQRPETT